MRRLLIGVVLVATSVALTGSGTVGTILGWSATEQCTPAAPGDTSGSVGSATVTAISTPTSVFAIDNDLALVDDNAGTFRGNVVGSPVKGGQATLSALGKLNFLVADRTVDPVWFSGDAPLALAPLAAFGTPVPNSTLTNATVYDVATDPYDSSVFVMTVGTVEIGSLLTWDYFYVSKYSSTGTFITRFGAGTSGSANGEFGGRSGLAVSPVDGSVAVGDGTNYRVQIFTPNGARTTYTYSTKVGTNGTGNSQFGSTQPIPVAYDSTGALYAGDRGNARIQKFTISGVTVTYVAQVAIAGFDATVPVYDLAFDSSNTLYATLLKTSTFDPSNLPGVPATIRPYTTSLVAGTDVTIAGPIGTAIGLMNITTDSTGIWGSWGFANYAVHYPFGSSAEDKRWYSGRTVPVDGNANYTLATTPTGKVIVGYKTTGLPLSDLYLTPYQVVSFDWQPVHLSTAIHNYMLECDSTLGGLSYSYDAAVDPNVVFPAWSGDVWSHLKEICTAYQLEIYLDGTTIRVEDIGTRTLTLSGHSALEVTPSNLFGGQQIVMVAQNPRAGGGTVFDAAAQNTRFQIDVGQTSTVTVNTIHYPVAVDPIVAVDNTSIVPGQYYVVDSTNTHVPAATWTAAGGSITPALGDVPGQIRFTMLGPTAMTGYTGPFTIADSTAASGVAKLILTGSGTFTAPVSYTFDTGANPAKTTQLVARTITNFAVGDVTQIAKITPAAIEDVSGYAVQVQFTIPTANLLGFGLTGGSLFSAENSKYRVIDIKWGIVSSTVTAVRHVTLNDIDTAYTGLTYDQQDAIWAASTANPSGFSYHDRTIKPLATAL